MDIPCTMILAFRFAVLLSAIAALGACAASPSASKVLRVRVQTVLDGDTFHGRPLGTRFPKGVKRVHDSLVPVRLEGVDAPERDQAWGDSSRAALERLVAGSEVEVEIVTVDKYRRVVGRVRRGSASVNERMVAGGHAWMFRRYSTDPTLDSLEAAARRARRGLWALPNPVEPSVWRRRGS